MRKCKFKKQISSYLNNELSAKKRKLITGHLKNCSICQDELRILHETDQYLKEYKEIEVPKELNDRLMAKIDNINPENTGLFSKKRWSKLAIAASVIVAMYLGIIMGKDMNRASENNYEAYTLGQNSFYAYFNGGE